MEKRFYSIKEGSLYSGLSARLLYQKCKDRELRYYKVNSKILIDRKDLDGLIIQGAVMSNEQLRRKLKEGRKI